MSFPSVALLGALLMAGTGVARAAEATPAPSVPSPAPPPVRGAWYGGTVLMFDGAMIATGAACLALSDSEGCLLPIYGYVLGGPVIHGRHQGWGRAFASLGLRVGLPLVGVLVGVSSGGSSCRGGDSGDYCGLEAIGQAAIGLAVGMAAAIAIDATWAHDDAPAPSAPPPVALSPAFSVGQHGGGIGLQGVF